MPKKGLSCKLGYQDQKSSNIIKPISKKVSAFTAFL